LLQWVLTGKQLRPPVQFGAGHTLCCVLECRRAWVTVAAFDAATGQHSLEIASLADDPQTTHHLLPSQLHTAGRRPFNPYGHLKLKEDAATASKLRAKHWASGTPSCALVSVLTCDAGADGDQETRQALQELTGAAELAFPDDLGLTAKGQAKAKEASGQQREGQANSKEASVQVQLQGVNGTFSNQLHHRMGRTGASVQLLLSCVNAAGEGQQVTVKATPASIVPCFALHECVLLQDGRTANVLGYEGGQYSLRVQNDDGKSQDCLHGLAQARLGPVFRYAKGTQLSVLLPAPAGWTDVVVAQPTPAGDTGSCRHGLHVTGAAGNAPATVWVDLDAANHSPQRFASMAEFDQRRGAYLQHTLAKFSLVEDGITGNQLQVKDQLLYIRTRAIASDPRAKGIEDVASLVDFLTPSDGQQPAAEPVLVMAAAGTGKTWTMWQLMHTLAKRAIGSAQHKVPMVIFVQTLAALLRRQGEEGKAACQVDMVAFYIQHTVHKPSRRRFLLQALDMRLLVVAVDGIDEASDLKADVIAMALEQLSDRGHSLIVTSRPEGVEAELPVFESSGFVLLDLQPLSQEQQDACVQQQLKDNEFYLHVREFSAVRTKQDELYATMDDASRTSIEQVCLPDLFKLKGSEAFDPEVRQRNMQGDVIAANYTGELASAHLREISVELAAGRDKETQEKLAALAGKQEVGEAKLWKVCLRVPTRFLRSPRWSCRPSRRAWRGCARRPASTRTSA
jgi:hypothetical protein